MAPAPLLTDDGQIFDAKKTGKIPKDVLNEPPTNLGPVEIVWISKEVGYGLRAGRAFKEGEFIFYERILTRARFVKDRKSQRCRKLQYQSLHDILFGSENLNLRRRDCMKIAFPRFVAEMGVDPRMQWADVQSILDYNGKGRQTIQDGQLVKFRVTEEEWNQLCKTIEVAANPPEKKTESCHRFYLDYAFVGEDPGPTDPGTAYIYLLASLINHQCPAKKGPVGPNCKWLIGPAGLNQWIPDRYIAVQAKRKIEAGEELTMDYRKDRKGFKCRCQTCRPTPRKLSKTT
ncbi:hypothetical protein V8F20_009785 [Naviculisporaceae sp. PSN 640]